MIVAFSGKARSGKTTAAQALAEKFPKFTVLSFATPLKRMAMEQFDLTLEDIADKGKVINLNGKTMTVRDLLIQMGQMYRAIDRDFWVKRLWKDASICMTGAQNILIDDLRFKNEAMFLSLQGATLARINRPGVKLIDDISETDLDDWAFEHIINNNGSLDSYKVMVKDFYENLGIRSSAGV
jgi:hypothetical protein